MRAIDRDLQATYADIVAEGVPEQFAELLRRLDEPASPERTQAIGGEQVTADDHQGRRSSHHLDRGQRGKKKTPRHEAAARSHRFKT
jgi:hypothetical protein